MQKIFMIKKRKKKDITSNNIHREALIKSPVLVYSKTIRTHLPTSDTAACNIHDQFRSF